MRNKGFTMIELVMVIVILAILAAVAIPKFIDLQDQAKEASEAGVIGGVRAAISSYYIERATEPGGVSWPTELDDAGAGTTAGPTNAFFDNVLQQGGITSDDWTKDGSGDYKGPEGAVAYKYDSSDGSLTAQ